MPVSDMPIPLAILVIIMIFSLAVIMGIFMPGASAAPGKIANLPFFGSAPQDDSGSLELGHKALHVKISPARDPTPLKIYEFHLTDQGALGNSHLSDSIKRTLDYDIENYFSLKKWKDDKCSLFATQVTLYDTLLYYVYYIDSGTIIRTDSKSLKDAISGRISSSGCDLIKKDCNKGNGDFTVCIYNSKPESECDSEDSDLIKQSFGSGDDRCGVTAAEGCPSNGCCSLLKSDVTENYMLAGGLMCGYSENEIASAKWWVCSPKTNGKSVYTKMKGEANAIQYKCNNGEWVSAADQGISLENPEIKYDSTITYDDYTVINFYLANHNTAPIKDVSIKATTDASAAKCSTFDCAELATDKSKDGGWAEVTSGKTFSSDGLKCSTLGKQFCWKAKKFSVEVSYTYSGKSLTDKFDISCNPSSMNADGVWQKNICVATAVSSTQTTTGSETSTCKNAGGQCASLAICASGAKKGDSIGKYDCVGENICCKLA